MFVSKIVLPETSSEKLKSLLFGMIKSFPLLLEDFALLDDLAVDSKLELETALELDFACELEDLS